MIRREKSFFVLETNNTTYCFRVLDTGHLENVYYGNKITINSEDDILPLVQKREFAPGNTVVYDDDHKSLALEDVCLEMSSYGKGDIREPFIEVVHADGSFTSDFLFEKAEILDRKHELEGLPSSYDENNEDGSKKEENLKELKITLKDRNYDLTLELYYSVFDECDVIARNARFCNTSNETVRLNRLMSLCIDLDTDDYVMSTFTGAWTREMQKTDTPIRAGKHVNASYAGVSSSRANPFFMMSKTSTDEDSGVCLGFNLIYSGNHYEAAEVNSFGKTRVVTGINPQSFSYEVEPGEAFQTPEAIVSYSSHGFNALSANMHEFVGEHIVRGQWKKKERPVLLNSWEAAYFDINEHNLLKLAKAGKEAGIELFVMDDGWFGNRNDDTSSLGDWNVNTKKLPGGLKNMCDKVKALGLQFGIWVEPEMVNVKSDLYKAHPDWAIQIPDKSHSEGRNQRILDLTRVEVQDYIIEKMTEVFSSADITYVKWDMNRIFSDYYSEALPRHRQGEVAHRYVIGLYRIMRELTERFPHILFEGCASGGNRFDLGILCYFPQIWASDNTDALCRSEIQNGYSYGYPMSTISAHVSSCPNHQTLRITPLDTRFNIAAFGVLGYECNFCDLKSEEKDRIKEQIKLYKEWRSVLQFGTFYRGRGGNCVEWTSVSKDKKKAVGLFMHKLTVPNMTADTYFAKGLIGSKRYHFYNRELKYNLKNFGDLVNTVSPIHIKQDSITHDILAKFVKMSGEKEDYQLYGDTLMNAGVKLKQSFGGTGYNEEIRYFPDFGSRLYFMEAE